MCLLAYKPGNNLRCIWLIVATAITLLSGCSQTSGNPPMAESGVLDLSEWDIVTDGPVKLDGQWEFYWSQFLSSDKFTSNAGPSITSYLTSPGTWRYQSTDTQDFGWHGYATLRLKVLLKDENQVLVMEAKDIRSAYELEVNGQMIASSGSIGKTTQSSKPAFRVARPFIHSGAKQLDIVVRLSDFHRDSGGFPVSMVLGTNDQINSRARYFAMEEWLLIGVLLFSAIYHLGLFFLRPKKIVNLYFGIFCINFIIRLLTRGEKILFEITPTTAWWLINKIEFATLYLIPIIYVAYYDELFKGRIRPWLFKSSVFVFGSLVCYVIFSPSNLVSYSLDFYLYAGVASVFCIVFVAFQAYQDRMKHSGVFLLGFLILLAGVINDFLYFNHIFREIEVFKYSCILFIFAQAYEMAHRSVLAFNREEKLSLSLDNKVSERTEQLSKANMVKGKLLSIVSHDLRGPLTSLKGLVELAEDDHLDKRVEKRLLKDIRHSIDSSLVLMDNILLWASSQLKSNAVVAQMEELNLRKIINQSKRSYTQEAKKKNIKIRCLIDDKTTVRADKNMLKSVFRNLINNSIKYTSADGEIIISSKMNNNELTVSVADSGIGMSEDMKKILFDGKLVKSRLGTSNEKGLGIGLLLCEDLIKQMGGKIWIESDKDIKGTIFSFTLPQN